MLRIIYILQGVRDLWVLLSTNQDELPTPNYNYIHFVASHMK